MQLDRSLAKGNSERYATSKLAKEYRKADLKNDMWAIGVVFYHLFIGTELEKNNSETQERINKNPLLKGLLEPLRENRFNIDQALATLATLKNTETALPVNKKTAPR